MVEDVVDGFLSIGGIVLPVCVLISIFFLKGVVVDEE
jgi:hypothetical protein